MTFTLHMMTAHLAPGDAIGNYIQSLVRIFERWSVPIKLYVDHPNGTYPLPHYQSTAYHPTGHDILWMHYSIDTPNLDLLYSSPDFKLFDSHGVSPPALFHGYDARLQELCATAIARLPTFAPYADLALAHTDYIADELRMNHFQVIRKLPLVVDTARFTGHSDREWDVLLGHLQYFLFVGRVVPQKGLAQALELFAAVRASQPMLKFFIVGSQPLPRYRAELQHCIDELGLADAVVFTGPISDPHTLSSFYHHARWYLCLSEWESFCVPLVEAMYCGTPVLTHDIAPLPETMGPGGIVLRGDTTDMAQQIQAVTADTGLYQTLQRAAQQHAQHYTDHALQQQLRALFAELATWS